MFLTICGLMATGTRTILMSRWRPGGQTSFDLVREFAQELPYSAAASAWQRSVQLCMHTELDPLREPRTKFSPNDQVTTASHPFFWSGYMLVDRTMPPLPEAPIDVQAAAGKALKN